jgi:hypothetical protein
LLRICEDETMAINNGHKQSPAEVLSSVSAEMAKPRVAESAKKAGAGKHGRIAQPVKKGLFRPSELRGALAPREEPI